MCPLHMSAVNVGFKHMQRAITNLQVSIWIDSPPSSSASQNLRPVVQISAAFPSLPLEDLQRKP